MKKSNSNINHYRRKVLKLGAASASLACVSNLLISGKSYGKTHNSYDVVIVGAGMAGLHAARELLTHGYRVKILEASHRLGGRIYSETLGETRIELGAEEHYLGKNNPIYSAVVEEYGKDVYTHAYEGEQLLSIDDGQLCWESGGDCLSDPDINNFWKYNSYYGKKAQHKDYSISLADDILNQYGVNKDHRAYHLYESGFAGAIFGDSLERIGAASLAEQDWEWTLSEDIRVLAPSKLGYSDVLENIWWNEVSDHVLLNTVVEHIDSSGSSVAVHDQSGNTHFCHKVIITASIGVLQKELIEFTPALPQPTIDAYTNIGMGRGMKIALRFKAPFWKEKMGYLVTEGLSSSCWVPTSYKTESMDHILMCYPMGDNGQKLTDIAHKKNDDLEGAEEIVRIMLSELTTLFGEEVNTSYIDGVVQDWTAHPYVLGSYSYPTPSTYANGSSFRLQLAQPINNQIFFAGEATNNKNPSCVPGALQEGARAARQIHKILKGVSNPPLIA